MMLEKLPKELIRMIAAKTNLATVHALRKTCRATRTALRDGQVQRFFETPFSSYAKKTHSLDNYTEEQALIAFDTMAYYTKTKLPTLATQDRLNALTSIAQLMLKLLLQLKRLNSQKYNFQIIGYRIKGIHHTQQGAIAFPEFSQTDISARSLEYYMFRLVQGRFFLKRDCNVSILKEELTRIATALNEYNISGFFKFAKNVTPEQEAVAKIALQIMNDLKACVTTIHDDLKPKTFCVIS